MSNESIFLLSALADILFIFFAARRGADWLLGTIVVNLILVGIFGAKLVTVFGFTTNAGNVFYACVFFATHFLLERYGKKLGMKTIWFGVSFILFFMVMSQFATNLVGISLSDTANGAISSLFSFSLRVTLASVLAYLFAQRVNIFIYEWIRKRTHEKSLWLRSNGANIISQLVDSVLFFLSPSFLCLALFSCRLSLLAGLLKQWWWLWAPHFFILIIILKEEIYEPSYLA